MQNPADSRYSDQTAPEKYEDVGSRNTDRMRAHREAIQRMNAVGMGPSRGATPVQPARTLGEPAPQGAQGHLYAAALDETIEQPVLASAASTGGPLPTTRAVAATCATCLSSSTMSSCQGTIFCAACHRSALTPRVEPMADAS